MGCPMMGYHKKNQGKRIKPAVPLITRSMKATGADQWIIEPMIIVITENRYSTSSYSLRMSFTPSVVTRP